MPRPPLRRLLQHQTAGMQPMPCRYLHRAVLQDKLSASPPLGDSRGSVAAMEGAAARMLISGRAKLENLDQVGLCLAHNQRGYCNSGVALRGTCLRGAQTRWPCWHSCCGTHEATLSTLLQLKT